MKKNMLTVVILALSLLNLVLSAVIVFTVLPASKRTDNLVTEVASIIKLEMEAEKEESYDPTTLEIYKITPDSSIMANLKMGADGKVHAAKMDAVTIYINKNSADYATYSEGITNGNYDSRIVEFVTNNLTAYTYDDLQNGGKQTIDSLKAAVLEDIKKYIESTDLVVDISFINPVYS